MKGNTEQLRFNPWISSNFLHFTSIIPSFVPVNCPVGTYFNVVSRACTLLYCGQLPTTGGQRHLSCLPMEERSPRWRPVQSMRTSARPSASLAPHSLGRSGELSDLVRSVSSSQSTHRLSVRSVVLTSPLCTVERQVRKDVSATVLQARPQDSGLEPCFPCPRGYFQHGRGTNHCYQCPDRTTTLFQSSDSVHDCVGLQHPEQYRSFEVLAVNDCFSLPCQNDAALCRPGHWVQVCLRARMARFCLRHTARSLSSPALRQPRHLSSVWGRGVCVCL